MNISRRHFIKQVPSAAMGLGMAPSLMAQLAQSELQPDYVAQGPVRHSVMGWCFNPMSPLELARHGKAMGLVAMEGVPASAYKDIRQLGAPDFSRLRRAWFQGRALQPRLHRASRPRADSSHRPGGFSRGR